MNQNPSATKSGPGRRHKHGHKKAAPARTSGADFEFVQHTATKARRERRAAVRAVGIRQYKRRGLGLPPNSAASIEA